MVYMYTYVYIVYILYILYIYTEWGMFRNILGGDHNDHCGLRRYLPHLRTGQGHSHLLTSLSHLQSFRSLAACAPSPASSSCLSQYPSSPATSRNSTRLSTRKTNSSKGELRSWQPGSRRRRRDWLRYVEERRRVSSWPPDRGWGLPWSASWPPRPGAQDETLQIRPATDSVSTITQCLKLSKL